MSEIPASATDIDLEIIRQLEHAPRSWTPRSGEEPTSAFEEQVFNLLLDAGFLEIRAVVHATMARQSGRVEATLVVSGERRVRRIWAAILDRVPEWLDRDQATRGRATLGVVRSEVRLTSAGQDARADALNPDVPSGVCSYVRRTEFNAKRGRIEPPIRVVSFRVVEAEQRDAASAPAGAEAPSDPSTAPIVVNNTFHLELGEALDDLVEAKVAEAVANIAPREEPTGAAGEVGVSDEAERVERLEKLPPSRRQAGESYEWVSRVRPDLGPEQSALARYTREQFEYLKEHYEGTGEDGEEREEYIAGLSFQTWSRYVREYLLARDGPVNSRREGRTTGSSVVRSKEVEGQAGE